MFEYGRKARYIVSEAFTIIMCHDKKVKLCKERPQRVRKNAAFLVDVRLLKNWEDVKDDMNGAYTKVLRCGVWTVECDVLSADHVMVEIISKKKVELEGDNKYHMIIHSTGNKTCPDLGRSSFVFQDAYGEIGNGVALLQYRISCEAEEVHFQVQSHGNRKKSTNTPFFPTAKSTLQAITDQRKEKPPSQAFNVVYSMTGGPNGAKSQKQVYDVQAHSKRNMDPVKDLVVYAPHKDEKVVLRHEDMQLVGSWHRHNVQRFHKIFLLRESESSHQH